MDLVKKISSVVEDRSVKSLARAVSKLIKEGEIEPGYRMPTTRDLAENLGMSPGAISDAWQILISDGYLETQGRRGTYATNPEVLTPWRQFRNVVGADLPVDLSTGFPDPELLLDLRPYLAALANEAPYSGYPKNELDPKLAKTLAPLLPRPPEESNTMLFTHVLGGLDQLLPTLGGSYAKVIVAEPEFAPYLDLLERSQLQPIALPMDQEGMSISAVKEAIEQGVEGIILQPRVHNPSGVVMTANRLELIAKMCAKNDIWIIDGDYYGDLNPEPMMTAVTWAPEHTIFIRAFSKEIHPDIRVAVFSGPSSFIQRVRRRRIGGFEVSRINQDLLRLILSDDKYRSHLSIVKREYRRRQEVFISTLAEQGIHVKGSGGFNVWVPVKSEGDALVYLASKGIGVAPGSAFQVEETMPHIRVSTASITGSVESIAYEVASAAHAGRHRY